MQKGFWQRKSRNGHQRNLIMYNSYVIKYGQDDSEISNFSDDNRMG
jgi:hypothetical protein